MNNKELADKLTFLSQGFINEEPWTRDGHLNVYSGRTRVLHGGADLQGFGGEYLVDTVILLRNHLPQIIEALKNFNK